MWDANVILHEWDLDKKQKPRPYLNDLGELIKDEVEPINNLVTWIYDNNNYNPSAKIVGDEIYSIVNDYLGTPIQAYNSNGLIIWERELDIYGKIRKIEGDKNLIPFLYQGQYYDEDIELAYNRFRMYSTEMGMYISQDPIGLGGGTVLYGFVHDTNGWLDVFGLSEGSGTLGRNMTKAGMTHGINPFVRGDFQAHHVIPHEVWVDNQNFFDDIGLGGAKDKAHNGVFLPKNQSVANQHGFDYYHRGSHRHRIFSLSEFRSKI